MEKPSSPLHRPQPLPWGEFESLYEKCREQLSEIQMWPDYFDIRYEEFKTFAQFLPSSRFEHVLELGSGTAFYSALLSCLSQKVTATEPPQTEICIHENGLARCQTLIEKLHLQSIDCCYADALKLPFGDSSFDFVLSSHVFGYLHPAEQAAKEVERVLKPGGHHLFIVPSKIKTWLRFAEYHLYLTERVLHHGGQKIKSLFKKRERPISSHSPLPKKAKSSLSTFPFPNPQNSHLTWHEEKKLGQKQWESILQCSTQTEIVLSRTTHQNLLFPFIHRISKKAAIGGLRKEAQRAQHPAYPYASSSWGLNQVILTRKKLD